MIGYEELIFGTVILVAIRYFSESWRFTIKAVLFFAFFIPTSKYVIEDLGVPEFVQFFILIALMYVGAFLAGLLDKLFPKGV